MYRRISSFFFSENGFGVDLVDAQVFVLVPPTGGAPFFGYPTTSLSAIIRFDFAKDETSGDVLVAVICNAQGGGAARLPIGVTADSDSAKAWVDRVNMFYPVQELET